MTTSTFTAYEDGEIEPMRALRDLCATLATIEDAYRHLEAERTILRQQIATIVARLDWQRAEVPGFGVLKIAGPAQGTKVDVAQLLRIASWLRDTDRAEIAEMLEACCVPTSRAGGLRIEREPQT